MKKFFGFKVFISLFLLLSFTSVGAQASAIFEDQLVYENQRIETADIDDAREYWQEAEIGGISFRYQIGAGGYFIPGNRTVQFVFDEPFSGTLTQSLKKGLKEYSHEIPETYSYEFVNARSETLELKNDIFYQMALYLEHDEEILKLGNLHELYPRGFIYSDSKYNELYREYFLTRDLSHIKKLYHNTMVVDKTLEKKEYNRIVEFLISGNSEIILNEEKNNDFLSYVFGENYTDYRSLHYAQLPVRNYDTSELITIEKQRDYDDVREQFVQIPYYKYKLGEISFTTLIQDRKKYIDAGISIENLLFTSRNRYQYDVAVVDFDTTAYNDFHPSSVYPRDEIKEKYANQYVLIGVIIVYLGIVLGFYFLYHKRLKRRSTIIYFSLINAVIFFGIFLLGYKITLGSQNLSYVTKLYIQYPNFTIEKTYDYTFVVKKTIFHNEFQDELYVDVETNDRISNRKKHNGMFRQGIIKYAPYRNINQGFSISPLRNIFIQYRELGTQLPQNKDFQIIDFDRKDEFMELPRPIKFIGKKYRSAEVKYMLENIENTEQIKKNYIITVDYTHDTN